MKSPARRAVAVIPARYASQRLPGKPLAEIAGKPMIRHVYERASQAKLLSDVFVATDDRRILETVEAFGGKAVLTPDTLQSGTDRIAWAARSMEDADIIVNIQGDEPLIPPAMIDQAVQPLMADGSLAAGTLVRKVVTAEELMNPSLPKVVLDEDNFCMYFSRSPIPYGRDLPHDRWVVRHTYYRHIGLYVFRRAFLLQFAAWPPSPLERAEKLEQLRILEHGEKIKAVVTELESIAVDTPEDLERVRALMSQNL
jgi:3-deoxy-manno-octulosonate cytidylyltransferase (CMP-KDO synthetase)